MVCFTAENIKIIDLLNHIFVIFPNSLLLLLPQLVLVRPVAEPGRLRCLVVVFNDGSDARRDDARAILDVAAHGAARLQATQEQLGSCGCRQCRRCGSSDGKIHMHPE